MNPPQDAKEMRWTCPIPIQNYPTVLLAHGGGGRLMRQLIEKMIAPQFDNPILAAQHDCAVFAGGPERLAFTTDSYVVHPLFFRGGDIGSMAVYGTVNDLAMSGARPLYLSAGFILEEGLAMETLWRIVRSMKRAADRCGVQIVTGDTKVVDKGKGDGIFINTSGIGKIQHALDIGPRSIREGDVILLNGDLGRHGLAILAARGDLDLGGNLESDSAPLHEMPLRLIEAGVAVHCLRDLTRGGLASALNELSAASSCGIRVEEDKIQVREEVRGACEILGFDPLYVANEGKMIAVVPAEDATRALDVLRACEGGQDAAIIGKVRDGANGLVTVQNAIGTTRLLDMLSGEQLPRIC